LYTINQKIEIKYFRSFGDKKTEVVSLSDINIFSGSNDCGKSNILRALNLFFNEEINSGVPFDIDRDFSYFRKKEVEKDKKQKIFVEIAIYFEGKYKTTYREKEFSIKKRWNNKSKLSTIVYEDKNWKGEVSNSTQQARIDIKRYEKEDNTKAKRKKGEEIPKTDKKGNPLKNIGERKGSITQFLNSIIFLYVPAVKDKSFYTNLYGDILSRLQKYKKNKKEELQNKIKNLSDFINTETGEVLNRIITVNSKFSAPKNLQDFFTTFEIITEDLNGMIQNINLSSRGDGIQAQFIPILLLLRERLEERGNPVFIWGFEEPENSYEYKNADKLARDFLEYGGEGKKQIFITTHSFNFLLLEKTLDSKVQISKYRVNKDNETGNSKILKTDSQALIDDVFDSMKEDLGQSAEGLIYERKLDEAKKESRELKIIKKN
jgi:predicted ATPase